MRCNAQKDNRRRAGGRVPCWAEINVPLGGRVDVSNIVLRDLQSAHEQLAKAKELLPAMEVAAHSMTEKEFRRTYNTSPAEALRMLRDPVGVSTMTLRTIETEPVFKGTYLGHGSTLQINFKDVKSVAFKETRKVDDFGP